MAFGDFVQGVFTDNPASPSTVAFTNNVVAGNLLVAAFGRATNSTPTVTDSQGNTYTLRRSHYDAGNDYRLDIWTAIAGSSGACSITITAAGGSAEAIRAEFAGPFAAAPFDVANSANGNSASASSGNVTPAVSGELAIGYHGALNALTSSGSWTTRVNGNAGTSVATILQSQVRADTSAFAATATLTSAAWISLVATFKSGSQTVAVGLATEADTAIAITAVKGAVTVAVGIAIETDTALAITVGGLTQFIAVGVAIETDTSLAATPVPGAVTILVDIAIETDTALAITVGVPSAGGNYTMVHHHFYRR